MLEIPTLAQLRVQAQQDLAVEASGALRSALTTALAYALAGVGYLFLKTLQFLSRQLFIDTASEPYALLWASIYGIVPNEATPASGTVQATGAVGATVTIGEIVQREDGIQYSVDASVVLDGSGEGIVSITALEAGTEGNARPGTAMTFVAPSVGVDADAVVVGADGLSGGFEAETAASVKARVLALIRAARRGGSEADYVIWATSIAGVAAAYARGSYAGIGTVLVIIAQAWDPTDPLDSPIPGAGVIASVEAYIATQKPAGLHLVSVQAPTLQPLDPYIVLDPDTPEIRASVTSSLALALADVEPGGLARYDDLVDAINRAAGEEHHRLFVSDGIAAFGPYDTVAGYISLIVPGTITWTEPV